MEGRALSRPGGAEQRNELARLDPQLEAAERHRLRGARAKDLEDVVELERAEGDLLALARLSVEAPYLHRKLSIISLQPATFSTPFGVPRSPTASLPCRGSSYRAT